MPKPILILILLFAVDSTSARAGVYIRQEEWRPLPAEWRGFLPDHRALRLTAAPEFSSAPAPALRGLYAESALKLEDIAKSRSLTADEAADLGGLYIRLGKPEQAVPLLRQYARTDPTHFRVQANLGTAWQLTGELEQAIAALAESARLAPPNWKRAEELHLRLLRQRLREGKRASDTPYDLFDVLFQGDGKQPQPGGIAEVEQAKIPKDAVAMAQTLALWLPQDARLLWLLAELANAAGDVRTAANILDGCVIEYGMGGKNLRERRQLYRAEADKRERLEGHATDFGSIQFRSPRALVRTFDPSRLPKVRTDGVNPLPWPALAETEIGRGFRPHYLDYVDQLDGQLVSVAGYPLTARESEEEEGAFLLAEYPVGCWFCEAPGPTQVLEVEPARGVKLNPADGVLKVTGRLRLNRRDPERLLFTLTEARVTSVD